MLHLLSLVRDQPGKRIYRNIPFITIYLQPRKLKVHPVIIPLPPQGHAAFIFHELPKGIIIRSRKACLRPMNF